MANNCTRPYIMEKNRNAKYAVFHNTIFNINDIIFIKIMLLRERTPEKAAFYHVDLFLITLDYPINLSFFEDNEDDKNQLINIICHLLHINDKTKGTHILQDMLDKAYNDANMH